ncbi:MAG TPA: hypothetical protein VGH30_01225 [Jatrophihabitantaceae bacterium]
MDTSTSPRELEAVRQRRAELREALVQFQRSLADGGVAAAVNRLASEFALHVEVTEGPGGLHQAILAGDLRLTNQVTALAEEHGAIAADIAALAAAPDAPDAAERGAALVDRLDQHRPRGADLIYEAYETDIGGGD